MPPCCRTYLPTVRGPVTQILPLDLKGFDKAYKNYIKNILKKEKEKIICYAPVITSL